jgi:predicted aconitase with swiveling domain
MSDWWNQATPPEVEPVAAAAATPETCPWCGAPATPAATYCACCGAVMAQREELGGLVVPGVTDVDPAVRSSSVASSLVAGQARVSAANLAGAVGGTSAQMIVAGAILARDHFASSRPEVRVEDVGTPSRAALEMAQRLRDAAAAESGPAQAEQDPSTGHPPGESEPGPGRPPSLPR